MNAADCGNGLLDPAGVPLSGTHLIEASAGTGKTYTITELYLRLVIEKSLGVEEILVVTFTEAATEELKERIRTRLRAALEALAGAAPADSGLDRLACGCSSPAGAQRLVKEALRAFDQAAIMTIHGFCRRMLWDYAFECGRLFDTELIPDDGPLRQELALDFWRRHVYEASPMFARYALERHFEPEPLGELLGRRAAFPALRVLPAAAVAETSDEESLFEAASARVREAWPDARQSVEDLLMTSPALSRSAYARRHIPGWLEAMDRYAAGRGENVSLFDAFDKFTSAGLARGCKKGFEAPAHPFFGLCDALKVARDALAAAYDRKLAALKGALLESAGRELSRRKARRNVQAFDDLLLDLDRALQGAQGERLAGALRRRYRAALVDEFQDTDPIQYAIFRKIFSGATLFLIGDPKQAIYAFRGADIYAYKQAAGDVQRRHTLGTNWRSEPGLVRAVNTLFGAHARPFLNYWIPYRPVEPAAGLSAPALRVDGRTGASLHLWQIDPPEGVETGKGGAKKEAAREWSVAAVTAETARLLALGQAGRAYLQDRPLQESDVAVLVRTNQEARQVQAAFSALRIPSVLHNTGNLFDTEEALEMERLLAALLQPADERLVRTAMATRILGQDALELARCGREEGRIEYWFTRFQDYHDRWQARGFIQMWHALLQQERVLPRLTADPEGERTATNVLHLAEVLHQAGVSARLGPADLHLWLRRQCDPEAPRREEVPLRLESDARAVRILTVHRSKGLEFAVVFCPFLWGGSRLGRDAAPLFHDPQSGMRLTLDLGSEEAEAHRAAAEEEHLAENLRLVYVAVTRAKSRCYLLWGRFAGAGTSALAYLFHGRHRKPGGDVLAETEAAFNALDSDTMAAALRSLAARSGGAIAFSRRRPDPSAAGYAPPGRKERRLQFHPFTRGVDRSWRISSFSSLVSGWPQAAEQADKDSSPDMEPEGERGDPELSGTFALPRGARMGTCLHALFERMDFTLADARAALVEDTLREHGIDPGWRDTVLLMVEKVLNAPLKPGREPFQLKRVANAERLNELEFSFPLKPVSPRRLKDLLEEVTGEHGPDSFPERIGRLTFSPARGILKGFMDLVFGWEGRFYLVDWKSNFLGPAPEDYARPALERAMRQEAYLLQYLLYTVALDRYLRHRVPGYDYETHFGGVFYIFLRGVDPALGPGYGIYPARPEAARLEALAASLIAAPPPQGISGGGC